MNIKTTLFLASLLTLVSFPTLSLAQDFGQMTPGDGSQDSFQPADSFQPGDSSPAPAPRGGSQFNPNRVRFGLDAALSIPTTGWGDLARLGIGGLARIERSMTEKLDVTGRAGVVYHLPKSIEGVSLNYWEIPILAGLKYYVVPQIFFSGELGVVVVSFRGEATAGLAQRKSSATKPFLALNLGMGIQINRHLDLRGSFLFVNPFEATEFMLGAGLTF